MNENTAGTQQALALAKRVRNGTAAPRKYSRKKELPAIVTPEEWLAIEAKKMSERYGLQPAVMRELKAAGWLAYHTWNSKHSVKGFPDVIAIYEAPTEYILLVTELKRETEEPTAEQEKWLTAWRALAWAINSASAFSEKILHATGFKTVRVEVFVWKPSDLLSGAIQSVIYKPAGMTIGTRRKAGKEQAS